MPEIKKLQFPGDLQAELLARGYDYALAVAKAAQKGDKPGGLARHLMDNGGPPDELLKWAQKAIELRTLDQRAIDDALRVGNATSDIDMSRPDEPPDDSLNHILADGNTVWDRCRDALRSVQWDPRYNDEATLRALTELGIHHFSDNALIVTGTACAVEVFDYHLNALKEQKITVRCFMPEDA